MNILVATEGPSVARAILPHAANLAGATGASMTVLRVLQPLLDLGTDRSTSVAEAVANVSAKWDAELRAVVAELGMEADVRVPSARHGQDLREAIASEAEVGGASVVAMRTNNSGTLKHATIGSVAASVLKEATVPVLAIGPGCVEKVATHDGYRILATDDGSPASAAAIDSLAKLFKGANVSVTLLRVVPAENPEKSAAARAELQSFATRFNGANVAIREAQELQVDDEIIAEAIARGADAIAMCTNGHGALRHLVLGSVAMNVVSASPMPVLLFRAR